jgi:hypothetical protein
MFPRGELGWELSIRHVIKDTVPVQHVNQEAASTPRDDDMSDDDATVNSDDPEAADIGDIADRHSRRRTTVTVREYAAYRMQTRDGDVSIVVRSGRLFQEWLVDQYAKVEGQRLRFIRGHQPQLRADLYQGLMDAINQGDTNARLVGRRIVLPS